MNAIQKQMLSTLALLVAWVLFVSTAVADPLHGRDILKFSQQPMDGTPITSPNGTVQRFWGHDELSTAYSTLVATGPDTVSRHVHGGRLRRQIQHSPVVHVKWWGSYLNNFVSPTFPIDKFLISFESDVPAGAEQSVQPSGAAAVEPNRRRGPLAPGRARSPKRRQRRRPATRRNVVRVQRGAAPGQRVLSEAGHGILAEDRGPGGSAAGNHHLIPTSRPHSSRAGVGTTAITRSWIRLLRRRPPSCLASISTDFSAQCPAEPRSGISRTMR